MGVTRGYAKFVSTRYYLRNGKIYRRQIWPVHSQGTSEQKPIKILEKRERGHTQGGTAKFFSGTGYTPYYLRNTNLKFCMHIYRLNRNKSPLNIAGKVAVGVVTTH